MQVADSACSGHHRPKVLFFFVFFLSAILCGAYQTSQTSLCLRCSFYRSLHGVLHVFLRNSLITGTPPHLSRIFSSSTPSSEVGGQPLSMLNYPPDYYLQRWKQTQFSPASGIHWKGGWVRKRGVEKETEGGGW
ncbi:hypothetical protein CEXT_531111 [Caerostris extrusa]|uniref:Secreted protein n=1 Tax=Caerostris extrusa TaxID=172846 RepID=A0AAV4XFP0_CAEEX|nr:hypothetical protein CEXT_531111 [Caerostris extrusa]